MKQTFSIEGMHCANCVSRLSAALQPFARQVAVTLDPPRAELIDATAGVARLNDAVASVGRYRLAPSNTETDWTVAASDGDDRQWIGVYYPLFVITGYIAIASLAGTATEIGMSWPAWMTNFMAGFFLVFSAFKMLDLRSFADAYASYDLLAKRWYSYGLIYPFIELALGLAYLFRLAPTATHLATIVIMGFSALGVIAALNERRTIQCACLGTVLRLPMSTVTLVEDLGMVAMAVVMLVVGH